MSDLTRWTIVVSRDTDIALRSYIAEHGGKKGDLSKFVERAVQREVFRATLRDIQERNADLSEEEVQALVDEEIAAVRKEFWRPQMVGRIARHARRPRHQHPAERSP